MMTGKVWVTVIFLCLHFSWTKCYSGTCWQGCLYSLLTPNCPNGGTLLRYNLDPNTALPSSLDLCGTTCAKNNGTKFYLIRQPLSGLQVITIRMASHCQYAIAMANGSVTIQLIRKFNNKIPTKFLFRREGTANDLAFKSVGAPQMYLALVLPYQAASSTNRTKNAQFNFFEISCCGCTF